MNLNDAENMKLSFGKHRGKTLGEIYKEAPDYIEWLSGKANDEAVRKAAAMILQQRSQTEGHTTIDDMDTDDVADEENWDDENIPF